MDHQRRIEVGIAVRVGCALAGMSVYVTVDTTQGAKDADSEADLDAPAMVQPQ